MRSALVLAVALALLAACSKEASSPATPYPLPVAAAASLRELLEQTAPRFETAHPGTKLTFSFDASSTLSRQIEAGGDFQVFLSADKDNLERIMALMAADTVVPFLSNRLALVVRADLAAPPKTAAELRELPGKLALAGPAVPAGKYARAYLTKKGVLAELEGKIVSTENVRATLALVESGAADAGFVYATDAKIAKKARMAWMVPPEDDPGILYVGGVVARGRSAVADAYVKWLTSADFTSAAQALGFLLPPPQK